MERLDFILFIEVVVGFIIIGDVNVNEVEVVVWLDGVDVN